MPNRLPTAKRFVPTGAELGLLRVAVVTPEVRVADVRFNTERIVDALVLAAEQGVSLAVFPELCITSYSCGDLFYQSHLLDAAKEALSSIADACSSNDICAVVGLPIALDGALYNCAALIAPQQGVVGIVPKQFLPSTNEFYEERWFTTGSRLRNRWIEEGAFPIPIGVDLVFRASNMDACTIGIEICEDLWAVAPPSGPLALAGAVVLVNPSASTELLGKAEYRRELVRQQSGRCIAAYLYAASGPGESTTDVLYGGHSLITENGSTLAEAERFHFDSQMVISDIDVQRLHHERLRNNSFAAAQTQPEVRSQVFELPRADEPWPEGDIRRSNLVRNPFVPADPERRAHHSQEIFSIQSTALARRLRHIGARQVVIGLSGGLDSTLALLVAVRAFDMMGLPHEGIVGVTMPGFGTSTRTRTNAEQLAAHLGVTLRTIPITDAVRQHFRDIGHAENTFDVTFENAQARERTQILMDIANMIGGIVVGTGDLSEAALGWMTFNGDHMSMYHVNAGVPKTLVRYLVEWAADSIFTGDASAVLHDIVATPITPELLPLGKGSRLEQKTEETIGPYDLHDFLLFQTLRYQYPPRKTFFLARHLFRDTYDDEMILRWMRVFYQRFFSQQFKRSSMPDGPKVGTVALSPRGDWRMPSDASAALWVAEIDAMAAEITPS